MLAEVNFVYCQAETPDQNFQKEVKKLLKKYTSLCKADWTEKFIIKGF